MIADAGGAGLGGVSESGRRTLPMALSYNLSMSSGTIAATIGRRTLGLTDMLLEGIPDERFARLPHCGGEVVQTNHPAFVFGHLALYGSRICDLAGDTRSAERVAPPAGWGEVFGVGHACLDDPEGTIYPARTAIMEVFRPGFEAAIAAAEAADEARYAQENPIERMRRIAPTTGDAIMFMLGSHPMYHLGQVSAWRRLHGLGAAMKL